MPTCLIIGASRGLGLALAKSLHARNYKVYATVRSAAPAGTFPAEVEVFEGIDLNEESAGKKIADGLRGAVMDLVILNAGLIKKEVCRITRRLHMSRPKCHRHSMNLTSPDKWRCTRQCP